MNTNDYMYAIDRSEEYLAHYGIKGMKWGVRKAIERGNSRALTRQYNKAARKLAKLQKRAENGKKYARRAAALGAGAAAAGGLAAVGTEGINAGLHAVGGAARGVGQGVGSAVARLGGEMRKRGIRGGGRLQTAGQAMHLAGTKAGNALNAAGRGVGTWGKSAAAGQALQNAATRGYSAAVSTGVGRNIAATTNRALAANGKKTIQGQINKLGNVSNNTLARVGAGALGAGLAAGAGYNAYRAATTKRAAKKAAEFQREMNQAFKGTQYGNGGNSNRKRRKR